VGLRITLAKLFTYWLGFNSNSSFGIRELKPFLVISGENGVKDPFLGFHFFPHWGHLGVGALIFNGIGRATFGVA